MIPIKIRKGLIEARPHIEYVLSILPKYFEDLLPSDVIIEIVSRQQLPLADNVWSCYSPKDRRWSIKLAPKKRHEPIRICVHLEMLKKEAEYIFRHDVAAAILLYMFKHTHVADIVPETKELMTTQFEGDVILCQELAGFIMDPVAAKAISPSLVPLFEKLERRLAPNQNQRALTCR